MPLRLEIPTKQSGARPCRNVAHLPYATGRAGGRFSSIASSLAITFASILVFAGCATGGQAESSSVKLAPGDLVRIIDQESGAPKNAHPVDLGADVLRIVLASIRFDAPDVDPDELQGRQLFTDEDLRLASIALADAFSRANTHQDIAVRLTQLRSSDVVKILRESHITAARMFYYDDRLNVILGRIDEIPEHSFATKGTPTPKIDYSVTDPARFYANEIGSRGRISASVWSPYLADGMRFHSKERKDWIEIDVRALAASNPDSHVVSDGGRRETTSPAGQNTVESETGLETRLRALRHLHKEGLISDELYEEKTRELIDAQF